MCSHKQSKNSMILERVKELGKLHNNWLHFQILPTGANVIKIVHQKMSMSLQDWGGYGP